MLTPEVRQALALARERLDGGRRDASLIWVPTGTDEALLRLVEAVEEADDTPPIRADLLTVAATASRKAVEAVGLAPSKPPLVAREWADVAARALEAYHLAPAWERADDEDDAVAGLVRDLRREIADRDEVLERLRSLLLDMHGTFAQAGTATAGRLAGRIAQVLEWAEATKRGEPEPEPEHHAGVPPQ